MKKLWLLILAVSLVAAFFVYRYVLSVALSFDCSNSVLSEVTSPDGRYIATVSERNCGATTPYLRVVSVRRTGGHFDGNDKESWAFEVKDRPPVRANWTSQWKLSINYSAPGEPILKLAHWGDVEIIVRPSE